MKKITKIILSFAFSFFIMLGCNKIYAATANIYASSTSVAPGTNVTVSASVSATEAFNLRMTTSGGNLTGNTSAADAYGAETSATVLSGVFNSNTPGTYTITLSGTVAGTADVNSGNKQSVSKSVTITVRQPPVSPSPSTNPGGNTGNNNQGGNSNQGGNTAAKNSNANLKKFGFNPSEYDTFKFNANTLEYRVNVPNELSSIIIYAEAAYGNAKVSGTGTRSLQEGSNKFEVTVTAEAGNQKKYILYINRAIGEEGEVPPNVIDEPTEEQPETPKGLTAFEITGYELDKEFKIDVFEYVAKTEEKITKEWLEEVKKKLVYTASAEELTVEVVTDVLEDEKGTITIIVKEGETEVAKYVVTFEREKKEEKPVAALTNSSNSGNGTGGLGLTYERKIYIIIGAFGVTLATAIFFAVDSYLKTKRLEEYDEEQEFEEDSEFERMNSFYAGFTGTQDATTTSPIETNENMEYDDNTDRISDELAKDETAEETAGEVTSSLRRLGGYRNMRGSGRSSGRHF